MEEKEARKQIGEKMSKTLDIINSFLEHYNYNVWIHSTSPQSATNIVKGKDGLRLSISSMQRGYSYGSREELLDNINVPEKYLEKLEKYAKNNPGVKTKIRDVFPYPGRNKINANTKNILHRNMNAGGDFAEDPQEKLSATIRRKQCLTADDLVNHNHMGQTVKVIGIFPKEPHPKYREKFPGLNEAGDNRYMLRCTIYCKYENGKYNYEVRISYPNQSILFAYDRTKNKMLMNPNFDETFLLIGEESKKAKGVPKKGILQARLKQELKEREK